MKNKSPRFLTLIFSFFLFSVIVLTSCISFRTSDKSALKAYKKKGIELKIHHKPFQSIPIRYLETGETTDDAPLILFLHGAPGSSNAFDTYLQDSVLLSKATLVSVDRLGYGYSNYGKAETSLQKQAEQVRFVLDQYPNRKKILVGHSFGGPIVARFMMDYPKEIDKGIMLAPAIDPDNEKIFSVAYLVLWRATRWLFSGAFKVSGDEKFSHSEELQKMNPLWSSIQKNLIHVHGTKDKIVPYVNIDFSKEMIPNQLLTPITWDKANHLIIWNKFEDVKNILLQAIEE